MKQPLWKRLRKFLIFCVVQLLVALVLLELLARIFDPLGVSYFPETARLLDTMVHEEPIGYRLKPGLDGWFHHAHYEINSLGFRGPNPENPKPPNERRIIWLGDSVVFGIGVNNDQTIPAVVEKLAATRSTDVGRSYRILNMGVPSYNTEQELTQFEELGAGLQPDGVILLFSPNDIEPKKWVFEKRSSILADVAQRSYGLSLLFTGYRLAHQSFSVPIPAINVQNYAENNPRWLAIADSLKRLKMLCDERSIPFVVLLFGQEKDIFNAMVAEEGRKDEIEVLFIQPWLDPRWPDATSSKYVNSAVDGHCNPAGCEMWGTAVFEALSRGGWFKQ